MVVSVFVSVVVSVSVSVSVSPADPSPVLTLLCVSIEQPETASPPAIRIMINSPIIIFCSISAPRFFNSDFECVGDFPPADLNQ